MIVQLALFILALTLLGLVIGAGRLIYTESERYQSFMQNRPVLGWIATTIVGGLAWLAASYVVFYGILLMLTYILRGINTPVQ